MRYVNGFFCVVLGLFAIVQYNDPDALLWFLIYGIPAAWAGTLAVRPSALPANAPTLVAFLLCLAAAVAGTIHMWPSLPANWIHIEEEREGLGLIIVTAGLIAVGWTLLASKLKPAPEPREDATTMHQSRGSETSPGTSLWRSES